MSTTIKNLLVVSILFGMLGIVLTQNAISRMRHKGVPPFNEGLYTAVWSVPPPPREVVLSWDSLPGRIGAWSSVVVVPILFGYLFIRRGWLIVPFLLLGLWSACSGCFGIWTWTFSLFA